MNRIIIIGNGFDLAHGMRTSYRNFIDDYWENIGNEFSNRDSTHYKDCSFENDDIKIGTLPDNISLGYTYQEISNNLRKSYANRDIVFKNRFLKIITEKNNLNYWVDIEDEYYRILKEIVNNPRETRKIEDLNKDFNSIKEKLAEYLKKNEFDSHDSSSISISISTKVYQNCNYDDLTKIALDIKAEQELKALKDAPIGFPIQVDRNKLRLKNLPLDKIKKLLVSSRASEYFDLSPKNILLLNFNYTNTDKYYINKEVREFYVKDPLLNVMSNNIHGSIHNPDENPIIFGYGDELDADYKRIEDLNENKYLENIKSINYLETSNYKSMLSSIEEGCYEVFIFGHSCGISDRTLLNTIFEHENCASIRVFYHKREDGSDNYSDVVRNISRNFNDKTKMRDRVVDKTRSEPLC